MARITDGLIWIGKRLLLVSLILTIDTLGPTKSLVKALNNIGVSYAANGNPDAARGAYNAAIWLAPAYATPYANRAGLDYARGDTAKALEDYRRAQELWPKDIRFTESRQWAEERLSRDPEQIEIARARHQDLEDRRPLYHVWPAIALAWLSGRLGDGR